MTVGFYYAGPYSVHVMLAARMVESVHRAMPGVPVVQFADEDTPKIAGVDRIERDDVQRPIAVARVHRYAQIGDWLWLDTDTLVQHDVRDVFDQPFDVAVATRAGTLKPHEVGTKFMARMPYNFGAVFSRSESFWIEASERMTQYSAARQAWMGDQQALNDTIASGRYTVQVLPNRYNYPPCSADEDVADKAILHYKGARKSWMLAR